MPSSSPRRTAATAIGIVAAALVVTPSAQAGCWEICDDPPEGVVCPDPQAVDAPLCMRFSPDGGIPLEVTVLGSDGLPLGDATVEMIFSAACDELVSCETGLPPTVLTALTDASGVVVFSPRLGGTCVTTDAVRIESFGCDLGRYDSAASADNDGDGQVGLADFVRFQMGFLSADPRFDFADCDDFVSLSDFVEFQRHFLAECP